MVNSITPPPELIEQWQDESPETQIADHIQYLATRAAQWGADQELEACVAWMVKTGYWGEDGMASQYLRAARRPKPPSLKEEALLQLDTLNADLAMHGRGCDLSQIRRALEALDA
jgi:hypothetical protein